MPESWIMMEYHCKELITSVVSGSDYGFDILALSQLLKCFSLT